MQLMCVHMGTWASEFVYVGEGQGLMYILKPDVSQSLEPAMLADQTILEKILSPPPSTRLKVCATTLFTQMLGTQLRCSYL